MPCSFLLKVVAALLVVLTAPHKPKLIAQQLGTTLVPAKVLGDDLPMVGRFKIAAVSVVGLAFYIDGTLDRRPLATPIYTYIYIYLYINVSLLRSCSGP